MSLALGCTRGKVVDESDDEVGGAAVELYEFPHSNQNAPDTPWGTSWLADHSVTSSSLTFEGYNYAFEQNASECYSGDGVADSFVSAGWHRQEIRKTGYDPYITYFRHNGYFAPNGVPCTQFAADQDCDQYEGTCQNLPDATLYETTSTSLERYYLDLIADIRNIDSDQVQIDCVWEDFEDEAPDLVALRFATGIANVGSGELRIESPVAGGSCDFDYECAGGFSCVSGTCAADSCSTAMDCPDELDCISGSCSVPSCSTSADCGDFSDCVSGFCELPVHQVIVTPSSRHAFPIDAEFDLDPDHDHVHLEGVAEGNVYLSSSSCSDTPRDQRDALWWGTCGVSSPNPVSQQPKSSFCLLNYDDFDTEIQTLYSHGPTVMGRECGRNVQQIQAGYKDVYDVDIKGQGVILDSAGPGGSWDNLEFLSGKNLWIEIVVDPDERLTERNRANNVTRKIFSFPTFNDSEPEWWDETKGFCEDQRECADIDSGSEPEQQTCDDYGF